MQEVLQKDQTPFIPLSKAVEDDRCCATDPNCLQTPESDSRLSRQNKHLHLQCSPSERQFFVAVPTVP